VAIYHLRLKVISRGLGRAPKPGGATRRSVVAAAAYRSGERLYDESQGKWFDYEKPDVVHTEIMAPEGVELPPWVFDRQTLYNQIEVSEKRKDAQLMREVEVTLPRELTTDQHIALVRSFVREHFVSEGMLADIAIHCPKGADGLPQPHAHVLLTLRRIDASQPTGFSTKKEREWNERQAVADALIDARKRFNNERTDEAKAALDDVDAQRNVNVWRKAWADAANDSLANAGSSARIDHRTLLAQGISRVAQPFFGIARHIEMAYFYLKDRLTHWVAVKKRAALYNELKHYERRDPAKLAEFAIRIEGMSEPFADRFRTPPDDIPEVEIPRSRQAPEVSHDR
jgi:ATP-dependent exoDNAse (exonuclease V) alpha subunit